jgi:uncharacterized protein Yka (UPF0111/DUF47 family)
LIYRKVNMLKRFLPSQDGFFTYFEKSADILVLSATQFRTLMMESGTPQKSVDKIAAYEEEADGVAHATFELLHKTFITPFDRHDIHVLTSQLDDIIDLINRCAQRFPFYHLSAVPPPMIELAGLMIDCSKLLKSAIQRLNNLSKADEIFTFCEEINTLESRSNIIVLEGEKELYMDEQDFKTFFKLKEIYSRSKAVINRCQDVANIIKGIVLEYS